MNIHQTTKKLALHCTMTCSKQLALAAYAKNNFSKQLPVVVNLFAINRARIALFIFNLFLLILSLFDHPRMNTTQR